MTTTTRSGRDRRYRIMQGFNAFLVRQRARVVRVLADPLPEDLDGGKWDVDVLFDATRYNYEGRR